MRQNPYLSKRGDRHRISRKTRADALLIGRDRTTEELFDLAIGPVCMPCVEGFKVIDERRIIAAAGEDAGDGVQLITLMTARWKKWCARRATSATQIRRSANGAN